MSYFLEDWAWAQPLRASQKLVLVALARCANQKDALRCHPSSARLVNMTGLDRETVFRAVRELETAGVIEVVRQGGRAHRYRFPAFTADRLGNADLSEKADQSENADEPGRKMPATTSREMPTQKREVNKEGKTKSIARSSQRPLRRQMPIGFGISERVRAWADSRGYDRLEEHLEAFSRKAAAKDYRYADWDAAFMEAIRENWAHLPPLRSEADSQDRKLAI